MQIIQSIRDKGAAIVIVVIALSLIGFILMDSKPGGNGASSALSQKVGKVNGENIELAEFTKRVTQQELLQERRSGSKVSTQQLNEIRDQVWNQLIAETVFYKEAKKVGIELTSKELSAILLSNDPSNPFLQQGLADQTTGKLDVARAQEALAQIKKSKAEDRDAIDVQILEPVKLNSAATKYSGMINASAYYPSWMKEKDLKEGSEFSNISYVSIPYNQVPDADVKVTDADIDAYVKKNKQLFKQEAGRKISYISFSQLPSADDSSKLNTFLQDLKEPFALDTATKAFIAKNGSAIEFGDVYVPKNKIGSTHIDTIVKQPIGTVYGPYAEQGYYILAKVVGTKQLPDSVQAKHILISMNDTQTGEQVRDAAAAKTLADSILTAVKGGADFAALALKYSSDGSKATGGDLGTFEFGKMVPEFNDYAFNNPVGSKSVVETQFGYHVIDILAQTNFKPAYKIAFLAKEITPSDATINNASLEASKASAIADAKGLNEYVAKNGLHITHEPSLIKENDFQVGAINDSRARELVRWVFKASKGDVSEPFDMGDNFIVATVDKIEKEGLQDAATARPGAEAIVIKEKKAAIIKTKLGNTATLETAAAAYNRPIETAGADSSLTYSSQIINSLGLESKVIGASFNKEYESKVSPAIAGTNGVYLLKVNSIQAKPADLPEVIAAKAQSKLGTLRNETNNWFEGLRNQADIKDKRSEIF